MFSSASSTYSLKRPARCIASLAPKEEESGEEEQGNNSSLYTSRFVVGTCGLREKNELHVIGFHEESNELLCLQVLRGYGGVTRVHSSSFDPNMLIRSTLVVYFGWEKYQYFPCGIHIIRFRRTLFVQTAFQNNKGSRPGLWYSLDVVVLYSVPLYRCSWSSHVIPLPHYFGSVLQPYDDAFFSNKLLYV